MVCVNVVVIAGTVSGQPVKRALPSGDQVTELRVSVLEEGRRSLPLPVVVWPDAQGAGDAPAVRRGQSILVHGRLVRRFYRSGAGARSLMEVVATSVRVLEGPLPGEA